MQRQLHGIASLSGGHNVIIIGVTVLDIPLRAQTSAFPLREGVTRQTPLHVQHALRIAL